MGVHWSASKQGGVADSTPMAELDSMHSALKNDGLPIADLLEFLLGRPVHIAVMEDKEAVRYPPGTRAFQASSNMTELDLVYSKTVSREHVVQW